MKKIIALVLALALIAGLCSFATAEEAKKKVGIAMPTKALERWNSDGDFLKKAFEDAGYEVKMTYSDNKADQQVNDIQGLLADGVELLIITAVDGQALNTVMDEAQEKGVIVVAYDRLIMHDAVSYYVSYDNYTVGTLQGQYVEEALGLKDAGEKTFNIEITGGDPADNNAPFFYQGAFDVLKPYIDAGTVIIPSGQVAFDQVGTASWDEANALDRAQAILGSYYGDGQQLDAWVCSNDSTARGVVQALSQDYKGDNAVVVTGQDADDVNLVNIYEGKQTMTVYKNLANEVAITLAVAKAALEGEINGQELADSFDIKVAFDTTSYETTPGNPCPSFLLVPYVITKDTMQLLADTGLYAWNADNTYVQKIQ